MLYSSNIGCTHSPVITEHKYIVNKNFIDLWVEIVYNYPIFVTLKLIFERI